MTRTGAGTLITSAWMVLAVVWLISAFSTKRKARRQAFSAQVVHGSLLVLGLVLIFADWFRTGFLGWRTLPDEQGVAWTGAALTVLGILFAIWARFQIGRNWSGSVALKEEHTLVRDGPYAMVRHPIYAGLLMAVLGTVIAIGEVRGVIGFGIVLLEWKRKSLLEERFMIEKFGSEYVAYRRKVKGLIPFVW